jgi:uncharacterized membrane protein YeaQ/YmgE (transglycosylase-associated protein family)
VADALLALLVAVVGSVVAVAVVEVVFDDKSDALDLVQSLK